MDFLVEQINDEDARIIDYLVRMYAKPQMTVFELGTYTGRSALTMLPVVKEMGGHLYCIDWFKGNVGVESINGSYIKDNVLDQLRKNLSDYDGYASILIGRTMDFARLIHNNCADIIFIDADHRYSEVTRDLFQWWRVVKRGGLMFGHDFECHLRECDSARVREYCEQDYVDGKHYGVIRAVCETFGHDTVKREGRIWYVEKE